MIKIEKEFSYGILAMVVIVGLVVLSNSGIAKIDRDELSGQAINLKNERNVDCFSKFETCNNNLIACNGYLTDIVTAWQTTQNELTSCQEDLAGSNNLALLFNGHNSVRSLEDNKIQHPSGDPFILSYFIKKTGTGTGTYPRIVSLSYWPNSQTSFETAINSSNNKVSWWSGIWHDSTISIQDGVVYFVKWEYTGDDMILIITDWESQEIDTQTWLNIGTIDFDDESIYIGDNPESDTYLDLEGFEGVIEQVRLRSDTNEILTYMFYEGEGNTIHDSINDYDGVIIPEYTEYMWVEGLP